MILAVFVVGVVGSVVKMLGILIVIVTVTVTVMVIVITMSECK